MYNNEVDVVLRFMTERQRMHNWAPSHRLRPGRWLLLSCSPSPLEIVFFVCDPAACTRRSFSQGATLIHADIAWKLLRQGEQKNFSCRKIPPSKSLIDCTLASQQVSIIRQTWTCFVSFRSGVVWPALLSTKWKECKTKGRIPRKKDLQIKAGWE